MPKKYLILYQNGTHLNFKNMLVVSSREFRDNQKKYFDLIDKDEKVIVQRGKNKAYVLTPVNDALKLSVNPILIEMVENAEKAIKKGKLTTIKDPTDIWQDIL
jgi:hypothetical protein